MNERCEAMKLFEAFKHKWKAGHERDAPPMNEASEDSLKTEVSSELTADETLKKIKLLTPREHDLFLLLLEGYTLKESAKRLSVKYSTANTHMTGIYKKLNINSRAELIIRYRDAIKSE